MTNIKVTACMNSSKVELRLGRNIQSRDKIIVDVNEIPYPTAIFFVNSNEIILNSRAYETLGMKENEEFNLKAWKKMNPYFADIIKKEVKGIITNEKAHVILPNGKHEIMNYSLTHITNPFLGNIYIIHFTKASEKYSVASISSLYSIKEEITKLKPYLNRTGKSMLESLMKKYFRDENQQLTLDDIVYYEKELRVIQRAFPTLSHREVILCGLLVNNMETKDIATITNRTLDSVFVTIHRINKKLNILNKKELLDTLKDLVNNDDNDQWLVEEFDV